MTRCAWCGASLSDAKGNPRYELFSGGGALQFVCRNGCERARKPVVVTRSI
jgi:hypothetical protein